MAKQWSWSFSKLKNFETCPKRHNEIDLLKNYVEAVEPGGPLDWGNRVHAAMAKALKATAGGGTDDSTLPAEMAPYQRWVDAVRAGPGDLYVEQKYAINKSFTSVEYFSPMAWYRGIGDVVRIAGPVGLVLDWKTGAIKQDSVQLALMAQCLFSHFPQLQKVRSEFVWLKEDCSTPEVFTRQDLADVWIGLLDRVHALEAAAKTQTYPPKPSGLCKSYCPVSSCPYHGKGARG